MTEMHNLSISRRELMLAAGGMAVFGGLLPNSSFGQQSADKDLIFRTTDPRNGEPALDKLVQSWITPTKHFYVRSHAPNPKIDPAAFRVKVEGLVNKTASLSLEELAKLGSSTVTATLTCAGNRRAEYNKEGKVGGVQWEGGAIGNATWSGTPLAAVLKQAGLKENAKHVWFEGLDEIERKGGIIPFGGSIPIDKAMESGDRPGAILAHKMNGETLTPDHGFPLRSLVPGYIGARSVKWLGRIVVSDRPSPNHYLATAYKIVKSTTALDWSEAGPIYRFPINGAICTPAAKTQMKPGQVQLSGYTLPTGRPGSKIKRVQISTDGGKTWSNAKLRGDQAEFCWQLWDATVNVTAETRRIVMRAYDTAGGFMPGRVLWNAKGYLQNSWYKLPVKVG